jgi:hypothetical protein
LDTENNEESIVMKSINFNDITRNEKENIFQQISNQYGLPPFAVEKDWWVVQTLSVIFNMEVAQHLVFKGGTSLSKAWNLIERFSEDIDLAIDREFLGYQGELSKNQRTKLRKAASEYLFEHFFPDLQKRFIENGFEHNDFEILEAKDSDEDPRIIVINYPNVISPPGYMQPKVQIEIGCRSLREPFTYRTFGSLVDVSYSNAEFACDPITVPAVNPERTFLEKIFLLHEEFHRPPEKKRVERLSRHIYDVVKLSKTSFAEKALSSQELYEKIVEHRYKFTRVGGINYNLLQPQTIDPVPVSEVINAWRADYNRMMEQIIFEENPPSFDQIMKELIDLRQRINSLPWRFHKKFPIQNI